MHVRTFRIVPFLFFGSFAAACSSGEPSSNQATSEAPAASVGPASAATLASARSAGLPNARQPLDHVVTGGQPTQSQVGSLIDTGFERFISLRPTSENGAGWEEAGLGDGATFTRIPIAGAADLTRENVEALDALLSEAGDDDTVLYCASGNRVGALLALRAAWLQDMPAPEALELGRASGLTRLEPAVKKLLGIEN